MEKVAFVGQPKEFKVAGYKNWMHCQRKALVSRELVGSTGPSTWHQRFRSSVQSKHQFINSRSVTTCQLTLGEWQGTPWTGRQIKSLTSVLGAWMIEWLVYIQKT